MPVWSAQVATIDQKRGRVSFDLKSGGLFQGRFTVFPDGKIDPPLPAGGSRVLLEGALATWEEELAQQPKGGRRDVLQRRVDTLRKMLAPP